MTSFDVEKRKLTSGRITDGLGRGLDPGLLPYIEAINLNPDIMTVQSCSGLPYQGHGGQGHPYVNLEFRNAKTKDHYMHKLKATGYDVWATEGTGAYVEIPNTITVAQRRAINDPKKRAEELKPYYSSPEELRRAIQKERERFIGDRFAAPQECRQFWHTVTAILTSS